MKKTKPTSDLTQYVTGQYVGTKQVIPKPRKPKRGRKKGE